MRNFLPTARPSLSDADGDAMSDGSRGVTVRRLRNVVPTGRRDLSPN